MDTRTINLRDVPEDLVRRAKAYAALQGLSLKDFILSAVQKVLDASGPEAASRAFFVQFTESDRIPRGKKTKQRGKR